MTEKGPVAMNNNKLAMSRALGAAFLNHQVEQLEKTVTSGPAANSNNWRERKYSPHPHPNVDRSITPVGRGGGGPKRPPTKKRGGDSAERDRVREDGRPWTGDREAAKKEKEKDADVVVVDASVLIHCIGQFKRWCRDDRGEIVIVPLEALNTLDLLKKGTSPLAQRARAASRILEAQVGVNPRIRVQRDDAFVLWDDITFASDEELGEGKEDKDKALLLTLGVQGSPEWIRRTICCARWEASNGRKTVGAVDKAPDDAPHSPSPKVVFAVVASPSSPPLTHAILNPGNTSASPVPLPAPQVHTNKHEPRSAGTLVGYWARKAGVKVLEVKPGTSDRDEEEGARKRNPAPGHYHGGRGKGSSHVGERNERSERGGGGGLVERPPAVMAMMEMVGQPGKGPGKVVRVLARGEKLEPDTP